MGAELHVLQVGPYYPSTNCPILPPRFEEVVAAQWREAQRILDEQIEGFEASGATAVAAHPEIDERPARAIVRLDEELSTGLVVVGSRGLGGPRRALMGRASRTRWSGTLIALLRWGVKRSNASSP